MHARTYICVCVQVCMSVVCECTDDVCLSNQHALNVCICACLDVRMYCVAPIQDFSWILY